MSTPVLDLERVTLKKGAHSGPDSGMCVMEAVSILAGEDFGDSPSCTSPIIATFLRSWNDALPDADRQQLKRHVMAVIGTNRGPGVDEDLAWMCTDWMVRTYTPAWLRLAGLNSQADLLAGMAPLTADTTPSILPALKAVRLDVAAAWDAAGAAAGAAAWDAAGDAAWAAAGAAPWDAAGAAAWDAAGAAAWAAARAAAGDAAGAAAWDAARAALALTIAELQASAHDLITRMCDHARSAA